MPEPHTGTGPDIDGVRDGLAQSSGTLVGWMRWPPWI
jgi:hypothetical protein